MIAAILAATMLFVQATPDATPGSPSSQATKSSNTVSQVTVRGQGSHATLEAGGTVICHDEVRLGSLFPRKICASKDEIVDRMRTDQQMTREATNQRPWRDEAADRK